MRICVIGGSGNVGSQVLDQLSGHGEVSLAAVARRPPLEGPLADLADWYASDIAEDDLGPALRGADVVIHLAWLLQPSRDPQQMARTNVHGTQRVLAAAAAAGVSAVVAASSVGAYSPGPKDRRVEESWATGGIASSTYSRHKAKLERMLDTFEADHPDIRVVRLRPGVICNPAAASEIARYFLGSFVPVRLLRPSLLPVLPLPASLALQAVHVRDVADAYVRVALGDAKGAFNVAGEPVLDHTSLARAFDARVVRVPDALPRALVSLSWQAHLQPTDPGWYDLGVRSPLMDTGRAQRELGWSASYDVVDAVLELLAAMRAGVGGPSPVLRPLASAGGRALTAARTVLRGGPGR